eukprot:TRINITY_DN14790_c0_g1_i1.p1 TRINITY_DN14790_c0_g1~~TRINITY_DN14790_c0_g1_i1.p1  ORF type:complete len:800 (+),score=246.21 TRINITY_DN14790_c0_g1_i1:51-2450(+)
MSRLDAAAAAAMAVDKTRHLRPAEREALGFGDDAQKYELSGLRFKMWKEQFRERYFGEPREKMIAMAAPRALPGGRIRPHTAGAPGQRLVRRIETFSKYSPPEAITNLAASISPGKLEALGLGTEADSGDTPPNLYPIPSAAERKRPATCGAPAQRSAVADSVRTAGSPTSATLRQVEDLVAAQAAPPVGEALLEDGDDIGDTSHLVTEALKRIDAFKDSLRELVRECGDGLRDFVRLITAHYDSAVRRLAGIVRISERKIMGDALTEVQTEALRLQNAESSRDASAVEQAQKNRRLEAQSAELTQGLGFTINGVNQLGRYLDSICGRLFKDAPKAPYPLPFEADAVWGDDAHSAMAGNLAHFETCVKGLFDDIAGTRKENYAMTQRCAQILADYNEQQRTLNSTRDIVAALREQVSTLHTKVSDMQGEIDDLMREKEQLTAEVMRGRIVENEKCVLQRRLKNSDMQISHYKDILATALERRDIKVADPKDAKQNSPSSMLQARGSLSSVPRFLRTKAPKVKNRLFTKQMTLQFVKEIWDARAKARQSYQAVSLMGSVKDICPFEDTVSEFCAKQPGPVEFGYSLFDACERFASTLFDCELFLGCVEGEYTDEAAIQGSKFVDSVRADIERLSRSTGKQGKMALDGFVRLVRTTCQGDTGMFLRCLNTLCMEKSGMELMEVDQDLPTFYPRFTDSLRRAYHIASHAAWVDLSAQFLDLVGSRQPAVMSVSEVRKVLATRDPFNAGIDDMLRAAIGHQPEAQEEVVLSTLLTNLHSRGLVDFRVKEQKMKRVAKRAVTGS